MSMESLTQIDTDDTDLRTGNDNNKNEMRGSFAPLRMTTKNGQRQEQEQRQAQGQKTKYRDSEPSSE